MTSRSMDRLIVVNNRIFLSMCFLGMRLIDDMVFDDFVNQEKFSNLGVYADTINLTFKDGADPRLMALLRQYGTFDEVTRVNGFWISGESLINYQVKNRKVFKPDLNVIYTGTPDPLADRFDHVDEVGKPRDLAMNGGIDFNAANLNMQIKRDGNGVPLPIGQQNAAMINAPGFIPVIFEIKPAGYLPIFSELRKAATMSTDTIGG